MSRFTAASGNSFRPLFAAALRRRESLIAAKTTQAYRVFSGIADGLDGVFLDIYGEGAVLIVYEGRPPKSFDSAIEAATVLDVLRPLVVTAVYLKPFAKDRSRLGGELPAVVTHPVPAAGEPLAESFVVREINWNLEIRLYDGLSTGLFLDQRENRRFVRDWSQKKAARGLAPQILNTFAYTCAFSVAAAAGGAVTTSVDVSGRYLEWGKRNFTHNGIDVTASAGGKEPPHRFAKMDTFEFFAYARRKELRYDLILLDPPSFGSGSRKKGIRAWSAAADYGRLIREAAGLLRPQGVIFASTNTHELCQPGRLEREIIKALGRPPKWIELPPVPPDFAGETDRFAARAFMP